MFLTPTFCALKTTEMQAVSDMVPVASRLQHAILLTCREISRVGRVMVPVVRTPSRGVHTTSSHHGSTAGPKRPLHPPAGHACTSVTSLSCDGKHPDRERYSQEGPETLAKALLMCMSACMFMSTCPCMQDLLPGDQRLRLRLP